METWKPIAGYEGLYEVSDLGQVRRIKPWKKLPPNSVVRAKEMRYHEGKGIKEIAKELGVTKAAILKAFRSDRTASKILKPQIGTPPYLQVGLCKGGKVSMRRVHCLVAETFLGPSEKEINHKNGIKTDARLENLEYVTRSENMLHFHRS